MSAGGRSRTGVRRSEHHQCRPPPTVYGVLSHLLLGVGAAHQGPQDLESLPLVERLLLADTDHRAGIGAVGATAQGNLVHDRGPVDQPADGAVVGPGKRRIVEDRGVLLLAAVQHVQQLGPVDAQGLGSAVQVEPVPGLVLDLGHQDRLATQRRRAADPAAFRLHPDDLGVRMLGDLADQRLAIGLWHLVPRLDTQIGGQQRLKGRAIRRTLSVRRGRCRHRFVKVAGLRGVQRLVRVDGLVGIHQASMSTLDISPQ